MIFDITISIIMIAAISVFAIYVRGKLRSGDDASGGSAGKGAQIALGIVLAIVAAVVSTIITFAFVMQTMADTYISGKEPMLSPVHFIPFILVMILLYLLRMWRVLLAFLLSSVIVMLVFELWFLLPYARIITTSD